MAVIGAGLAGLTCAFRLKQAGVTATVYEASSRVGGRCLTDRTTFAEQFVEIGGELIDSWHEHIRKLCGELQLELDDVRGDEPLGATPRCLLDGREYPWARAGEDFRNLRETIVRDSVELDTIQRSDATKRALELDRMCVDDYLRQLDPQGRWPELTRLLSLAATSEFGLDTSATGASSLVWMLAGSPATGFEIFGSSDERYRVRGGNDRIATTLARALEPQLQLGVALTAVRRTPAGRYELTLEVDRSVRSEVFDAVVLTVPFSVMRERVDCQQAGFSESKLNAIAQLQLGVNAKHHLQFSRRTWRQAGGSGEVFSNGAVHASWDVTRCQSGDAGIVVNYLGGSRVAAAYERRSTVGGQVAEELNRIFPGTREAKRPTERFDNWLDNPWSRGSYCAFRPGDYRALDQAVRRREANCVFAGEHTGLVGQGFMNGAVESGARAAREVLDSTS